MPFALEYLPFLVAAFVALLTLLATAFWRWMDQRRTIVNRAGEEQGKRSLRFDSALQKIEDAVWYGRLVSPRLPQLARGPSRRASDPWRDWPSARERYNGAFAVWRQAWMKTRPDDQEFVDRFRNVGLLLEAALNLDPEELGWDVQRTITSLYALMTAGIDDARGRYWSQDLEGRDLPPFAQFEGQLVEALQSEDALDSLARDYGKHPDQGHRPLRPYGL